MPPTIQAETLAHFTLNMIILSGSDLLSAISRSPRSIKQLSADGELVAEIAPNDALLLAKITPHVGEVRGHKARVRSIRPVERPRVITDAFPDMPVLWTIGYERRTAGRQIAA